MAPRPQSAHRFPGALPGTPAPDFSQKLTRTMVPRMLPLCCGMAAVHQCGPTPTMHAAIEEMPNEKPPKRKPGRPASRTSHTAIDFHLTPKLHEAMKAFAAERKVLLEDVYREAAEHFLERRAAEEFGYWAPPHVRQCNSRRRPDGREPARADTCGGPGGPSGSWQRVRDRHPAVLAVARERPARDGSDSASVSSGQKQILRLDL